MKRKRHCWQVLLFVAVLIVPSVLMAFVGWNNIKLDREKRQNEAQANVPKTRNQARTEIAKDAWERLQNIKLQAIGSDPGSDPAVKFLTWTSGDRLVMAWDTDPSSEALLKATEEPGFVKRIDAARAEIDSTGSRAAASYNSLIQTAANDYQRALARLELAGAALGKFSSGSLDSGVPQIAHCRQFRASA